MSNGGGLLLGKDGQSVYVGSADPEVEYAGGTGEVTVITSGSTLAEGANGTAIFAQNLGGSFGVTVAVNQGMVRGGSGQGQAVWVDSTVGGFMTVAANSSVQAASGNALLATLGPLSVINAGTITGSARLNGGAMTNNGTYSAGEVFEGDLVNNSLVALGSAEGTLSGLARKRFAQTTLTGSFVQSASGTLQVGADFNTLEADRMLINGPVTLAGDVRVVPRALLLGRELTVLTVNGIQRGALTANDSPVFDYEVRQAGTDTHVRVAGANFNAPSMALASNQSELGSHLQRSWDLGGNAALSSLYAALDQASRTGAGEYQSRISDLSPGVALAPAAQMQFAMARFTGAMMSCPKFQGLDAMSREQNCFWGEVTGRHTRQDGTARNSSFDYDSVTYQFGGQREIAPNWFLGGSMAYQDTRLKGDDHRVSGNGDSGYAGVVLKRQVDQWTFSGALGGGYGSYDIDRNLNIAGFNNTAKSSPDVYSFGARLRAARTFTNGNVYLKPYVDLDATYSRMPTYSESGDALRLKVHGSDQAVLGLAPTLEVGGRVDLPKGAVMRPYAFAGVSFLSENGWNARARLQGAPSGTGSFTTTLPTANVMGRVGAGLQVSTAAGVDFRLQYDGEFSSQGRSHAGAVKMIMPF